jgi:hypothetical protein
VGRQNVSRAAKHPKVDSQRIRVSVSESRAGGAQGHRLLKPLAHLTTDFPFTAKLSERA